MDPVAVFLLALGIWLILSEVVLPNLDLSPDEVPEQPEHSV
jgi:hypothetical protein